MMTVILSSSMELYISSELPKEHQKRDMSQKTIYSKLFVNFLDFRPAHSNSSFAEWSAFWATEYEVANTSTCGRPGGNFIGIILKVIVEGAANTMALFQPENVHGTTISDPLLE